MGRQVEALARMVCQWLWKQFDKQLTLSEFPQYSGACYRAAKMHEIAAEREREKGYNV